MCLNKPLYRIWALFRFCWDQRIFSIFRLLGGPFRLTSSWEHNSCLTVKTIWKSPTSKKNHTQYCMYPAETIKGCDRNEAIKIPALQGQRHQCVLFYFIIIIAGCNWNFSFVQIRIASVNSAASTASLGLHARSSLLTLSQQNKFPWPQFWL